MLYFNKLIHSPMGSAWNLFSAAHFEGSSDPGTPGSGEDESELSPDENQADEGDPGENPGQGSEGSMDGFTDPVRTKITT